MNSVPLRRRLFMLAAAGILPLAVVAGIALLAFFYQQREQAQRAGLEITRALSTAVDAELRRDISVLEVLATSPLLDNDDLAAFLVRSERSLAAQPHWRSMILALPDGTPLMDTRVHQGQLPAIAERQSFDRAVRERRPVVGDLARGPRGEWAIPVRVPVERGGKLRYVLTAAVSPDAFIELVQRQRVPGDWVVAIFDSRHQRIARSRESQYLAQLPAPSFQALVDQGAAEGTGLTATVEGDAVYSAFTRLAEPRWVIGIGVPRAMVEGAAWRSAAVYGGGVLLSIVAGILVAIWLARTINLPMARLRNDAAALGRGDPVEPVDTDIPEIREVADALVASSQARRRHEAEREELLAREQAARAFAESANKSKDEFLAMLGHELRNPLGAIGNAVSLLQNPRAGEDTRRQAREIIARQVGHLTRLTDDLLDAARALTGKIVLDRGPTELAALVAQALRTMKAAGRTQKHRVLEELREVWVDADPIRIEQIVMNLVGNAVKYTPAGGTIRVVVEREGGEAVLRVADTGVGISPELAGRVFDLFVQGDRDLDRSLGGLGIGLTLVQRLAQMHGGTASVESGGAGQGSEFTVRLPAIAAPVAAVTPAAREEPPSPREVLVVEDNADARETLGMLLELAGHRVHSAADGPEGLRAAMSIRPDVMLVDIGLPEMDGYEVARQVRRAERANQPYMIALTGYGSPDDRQRALDAGFDAHLVKPVDFDALAAVLQRVTSSGAPSGSARP